MALWTSACVSWLCMLLATDVLDPSPHPTAVLPAVACTLHAVAAPHVPTYPSPCPALQMATTRRWTVGRTSVSALHNIICALQKYALPRGAVPAAHRACIAGIACLGTASRACQARAGWRWLPPLHRAHAACHPCTPPVLPATPAPHPCCRRCSACRRCVPQQRPHPPGLSVRTTTTQARLPCLHAMSAYIGRWLLSPLMCPHTRTPDPAGLLPWATAGSSWSARCRMVRLPASCVQLPTAATLFCLLACRGCCLSLSEACRAHAAVHDFAQATVTMPLGASHCRRASQVGTRAAQFAPAIPPLTVCSPPFPSCFHLQTCAPGGSRCCTSLRPPCRTAACAASQSSSNGVSTRLVAGVWPLWMGVWLMDPSRRLVWPASAACRLVAWWLLGRRVEPKSLAQPLWSTGR